MASRILLVEDSPTVLNLLALILRQGGHAVVTAGDGAEALEKLKTTQVDLIITDVNMPRMDGFALVSHLRTQPRYARVPIIILSTERGPDDRSEGLARGADLYLAKPVGSEKLLGHVQDLLAAKAGEDGQAQP